MIYSLGSLTAVITNLNPFVSVPHPSVTYFNVTKFVRVNMAPTDCFVFRHVISDWKKYELIIFVVLFAHVYVQQNF